MVKDIYGHTFLLICFAVVFEVAYILFLLGINGENRITFGVCGDGFAVYVFKLLITVFVRWFCCKRLFIGL